MASANVFARSLRDDSIDEQADARIVAISPVGLTEGNLLVGLRVGKPLGNGLMGGIVIVRCGAIVSRMLLLISSAVVCAEADLRLISENSDNNMNINKLR